LKKQKAELLQGTLELLILRLLGSGHLNGWDIMQRIARRRLRKSPASPRSRF
jgi:DNA-binding PadR family transcriptional regulator